MSIWNGASVKILCGERDGLSFFIFQPIVSVFYESPYSFLFLVGLFLGSLTIKCFSLCHIFICHKL